MKYTIEELNQFKHGISTRLVSLESAQFWKYDEEIAEEINWLQILYDKTEENIKELSQDVPDINVGKLGWIPVSERLPEEDGFYIATLDGEICGEDKPFCGLAEFEKGKWIDDEEDYQCIIAWMPLPKPYSEGSE